MTFCSPGRPAWEHFAKFSPPCKDLFYCHNGGRLGLRDHRCVKARNSLLKCSLLIWFKSLGFVYFVKILSLLLTVQSYEYLLIIKFYLILHTVLLNYSYSLINVLRITAQVKSPFSPFTWCIQSSSNCSSLHKNSEGREIANTGGPWEVRGGRPWGLHLWDWHRHATSTHPPEPFQGLRRPCTTSTGALQAF